MRIVKPWSLVVAIAVTLLTLAPIHGAAVDMYQYIEPIHLQPPVDSVSIRITNIGQEPAEGVLQLFENGVAAPSESLFIMPGDEFIRFFRSDSAHCVDSSCYVVIIAQQPLRVERAISFRVGEEPKDYPAIYLHDDLFSPTAADAQAGASRMASHNGENHAPLDIQVPTDVYSITIRVGSVVSWVREEGIHSVTADDGTFDSGAAADDWVIFSHTFDEAGQFPYYCKLHGAPGGVGMAGIINVIDTDTPDPDPEPEHILLLPHTRK